MKSSVRRIIGRGDSGEDVRRVQHMLNVVLSRPIAYPPRPAGFRETSERDCPGLWGYEWAPGGRAQFIKMHLDAHKYRRPIWDSEGSPHLAEDGIFGPKTEAAVIRFQHRCGLPDDGVVGPETWDLLFPLYSVKILVLRPRRPIDLHIPGLPPLPQSLPGAPLPPPPSSPPPAERTTEFDNIAEQMGVQVDKNGAAGVFAMQATWKTSRLPNEFLPGHWEHTGGLQAVKPLASETGKNLQVYYQITRAEVLDIKLSDELKITADLWIQPFVQLPLDAGSGSKPNLVQFGANTGATVQLEVKTDEDAPTIKVFVQGAGTGTADSRGGFDGGGQLTIGVLAEFEPEYLLGVKKPKRGPVQPQAIRAEPSYIQLKRGGQANFRITLQKSAQKAAQFNFWNLPAGVTSPLPGISAYANSAVVNLSASPTAALGSSEVLITYDATTNPKQIEVYRTSILVEVVP